MPLCKLGNTLAKCNAFTNSAIDVENATTTIIRIDIVAFTQTTEFHNRETYRIQVAAHARNAMLQDIITTYLL